MIDRCVNWSEGSYAILFNLRRLNHWYREAVDAALTQFINDQYKPEDLFKGFQILVHKNLYELPPCFRSDLKETLFLYFHAKRYLDDLACQAFARIFEDHLEFFKSLCHDKHFSFLFSDFLVVDLQFDHDPQNNLHLILGSSCSAYLFTHFLKEYLMSKDFTLIKNIGRLDSLICFLQVYQLFDFVSDVINDWKDALSYGLLSDDVDIRKKSIYGLNLSLSCGLFDQLLVSNLKVKKVAELLSHDSSSMRSSAVSFIAELAEKGLIDLSLINELNLVEKLVKSDFSDAKEALASFIEQFPSMKDALMGEIALHLWDFVLTFPANMVREVLPFIESYVKHKLIDHAFVTKLVAELTLVEQSIELLSNADKKERKSGLCRLRSLAGLGCLDLSLIIELQLVEKIMECGFSFKGGMDIVADIFSSWIEQFPTIKHAVMEKAAQGLEIDTPDFSGISLCLFFKSCLDKNLIDQPLVTELQLVPKVLKVLSYVNQEKQKYAVGLLKKLLREDFLAKCLVNYDFVRTLLGLNFNHNDIGESVQSVLDRLIEKSLITKFELAEKIVQCLAYSEDSIKRNAIWFLRNWKELDKSMISELELIKKIIDPMQNVPFISLDLGLEIFEFLKHVEQNQEGYLDLALVKKLNLVRIFLPFLSCTNLQIQEETLAWFTRNFLNNRIEKSLIRKPEQLQKIITLSADNGRNENMISIIAERLNGEEGNNISIVAGMNQSSFQDD